MLSLINKKKQFVSTNKKVKSLFGKLSLTQKEGRSIESFEKEAREFLKRNKNEKNMKYYIKYLTENNK
ncbi:hypothetical protein NUSPORA_02752 [Nucleospora cyclopteri]